MFSIVWSVMILMNLYKSWGLEFLFWTQMSTDYQDFRYRDKKLKCSFSAKSGKYVKTFDSLE